MLILLPTNLSFSINDMKRIGIVVGLWALDDTFPRSLGGSNEMDLTNLWSAGLLGIHFPAYGVCGKLAFGQYCQLASLCEQSDQILRTPTKFSGVRQNSPDSDKILRTPTKFSGVRQNSPDSDKILRTPTKFSGIRPNSPDSDKTTRLARVRGR